MRILFDTNVLIHREDDRVISSDVQELQQLLNRIGATILVHPLSLNDLENDKDTLRKERVSSKIKTYIPLRSYPDPQNPEDNSFINAVGIDYKGNDKIDTAILYSVYKNAVDFLITEDRGIHKKAEKVGLEDRVLLIADALQTFRTYLPVDELISPPALEKVPVYTLDLSDPIFDSLKGQYPEFESWFEKISRQGRECWVYYRDEIGDNKKIGALLIYKEENDPIDSQPPLSNERRLKISLFKVTYIGHKIGELFIKLTIDYCIKNNIASIYLTHFTEDNDQLIELISQYGFMKRQCNDISVN